MKIFWNYIFNILTFMCIWILGGTIIDMGTLSTPWIMAWGYVTVRVGSVIADYLSPIHHP